MGAEQSLIGGRKRNRSVDSNDNKTFEAYKTIKKMLEEQGKDFEKQVFLDLPDARVLKRLGILEDCDIGRFDDKDCKNSIKNIVINAHGSLMVDETEGPLSVTIPENIVVLFMGELGYITWISGRRNISKDICNKELVPNQIGLPGSTIPNVSLSAEYNEDHTYSTGIYDCDLNKNDIVNQFEGFEHYLIPTKEKVIKSMKPEVKEMLKKATKEGEKIINRVTLNEILPKISEKIPKDKYGFVYVFSCLGVCNWKTQDEIELYTKPIGLSSVRGYTVKKIPARTDVSRYSIGDDKKWNPVLTNDRNFIDARNWFVDAYNDLRFDNKKFINKFRIMSAFDFDENWRDHLPEDFIQNNESKLRKSAVVNHFKFIDLLHEGDLEKIKKAWNMQFEDKTKFLLPRDKYIDYSKKRNLGEEIIDLIDKFEDNKEIIENIDENNKKILDLFKKDDIETAKVLLFDYMKKGADDVDVWYIYRKLSDYPQNIQDMVYMHWSYDDLIRIGEEGGIEDFIANMEPPYGEEEQIISYRNALDIKPYLDYVNSAEYVHPDKDYVIEQMNKLRDVLGFPAIQQGGQAGQVGQVGQAGQAGQYGGMWQRGGFFMTCC